MGQGNGAMGAKSKDSDTGSMSTPQSSTGSIAGVKLPSRPFDGFVPRPPKHEMNLVNAWSLAMASSLAYNKREIVFKKAEEWGLKGVDFFGYGEVGPDTQVWTGAGDGFVLVAFRGTEFGNWDDMYRDLQVWQCKSGPLGCRVHQGFLDGLTGLWRRLTDPKESLKPIIGWVKDAVMKLERENGNDLPIFLTGHSLGAALATLATAYFLEDEELKDKVEGLYTYGSPRVGTKRFRDRFHSMTKAGANISHRFRNREDIVTRIPHWWKSWYAHVGTPWYLKGDDQELLANASTWDYLYDIVHITWDGSLDCVRDHKLTADENSETEGPRMWEPEAGVTGGYIDGLWKNLKARGML